MPHFSDYDLWKLNPPWVWEDDEREEDPFMDWADYESERQFDVHASHYEEPELACIPAPNCSAQEEA